MKTPLTQTAAGPFVSTRPALSRRKFLRGAGILLTLPMLDAMTPAFAAVAKRLGADATPGGKPRRFFGICNNLGLLPEQFFPKESGRDYPLSPYLEVLKEHRNDFTVFSGVSHPDVDGGHPADNCFLTAAPHPGRGGGTGERIAADGVCARPRPPRSILYQRPRSGTAHADVPRMGAKAQTEGQRLRAARSGQPQSVHGKGEPDV